jgi:hypothetical protein
VAPGELEVCVRAGGEDGARMVLRTLIFSVLAAVVTYPLFVGWNTFMNYLFHLGLTARTAETVYVGGQWLVIAAWPLGYLAFVTGPFMRSMRGLRETGQAIVALETMPAEARASWVEEYGSESRPACAILERRSPLFRSFVAAR